MVPDFTFAFLYLIYSDLWTRIDGTTPRTSVHTNCLGHFQTAIKMNACIVIRAGQQIINL